MIRVLSEMLEKTNQKKIDYFEYIVYFMNKMNIFLNVMINYQTSQQ